MREREREREHKREYNADIRLNMLHKRDWKKTTHLLRRRLDWPLIQSLKGAVVGRIKGIFLNADRSTFSFSVFLEDTCGPTEVLLVSSMIDLKLETW